MVREDEARAARGERRQLDLNSAIANGVTLRSAFNSSNNITSWEMRHRALRELPLRGHQKGHEGVTALPSLQSSSSGDSSGSSISSGNSGRVKREEHHHQPGRYRATGRAGTVHRRQLSSLSSRFINLTSSPLYISASDGQERRNEMFLSQRSSGRRLDKPCPWNQQLKHSDCSSGDRGFVVKSGIASSNKPLFSRDTARGATKNKNGNVVKRPGGGGVGGKGARKLPRDVKGGVGGSKELLPKTRGGRGASPASVVHQQQQQKEEEQKEQQQQLKPQPHGPFYAGVHHAKDQPGRPGEPRCRKTEPLQPEAFLQDHLEAASVEVLEEDFMRTEVRRHAKSESAQTLSFESLTLASRGSMVFLLWQVRYVHGKPHRPCVRAIYYKCAPTLARHPAFAQC